jgi:hypothetical protein
MQMQVSRHAGPRRPSQIHSKIETVRVVKLLQNSLRPLRQIDQFVRSFRRQRLSRSRCA